MMPRPKRRPGGQPGNLNALKHGFYSQALRDAGREDLAGAEGLDAGDLTPEIALLRQRLKRLLEAAPERLDLLLDGLRTLASLVKTQYQLKGTDADRLQEAMGTVLRSIEEAMSGPGEANAAS